MTEDVPVKDLQKMVFVLVGYFLGMVVTATVVKFLWNAIKPTITTSQSPTRQIVVRRRSVQIDANGQFVATSLE